jgi:GNAT superfamily N-acetyltransferase
MSDKASCRILPVRSRRDLTTFIRLPGRLYAGRPGFTPALEIERRETLDRGRNPYFQHAEAELFLAWRGDRAVGRISAQIDRLALERERDATGHFGFLDAIDDPAVFAALIGAAEEWLASRAMRRALGPLSFSTNEECGLMVEGFDERPMLMMSYHPPYAAARLVEQGYAKCKDLFAYDYDVFDAPAFKPPKVIERAVAGGRLKLRPLDMRRYDDDIRAALEIYLDAWSENWGHVPPTQAETDHAVKTMKPLVKPQLVWLAELDGKASGMIVCLPNLAEAAAGLDGRLLPLGWARLLWRLKVSGVKSSRVMLFGVLRRYQGTALGAAMSLMLLHQLRTHGRELRIRHAELSWVLEDNVAMRRLGESIGSRAYKVYRIYEKALA